MGMENGEKIIDFYMGANSPDGFQTYYSEFEKPTAGFRSFLIKGGAGTGKSSILKRIITDCGEGEPVIERLHCSSDPNSLDGVVLYGKRISACDATPPHVIEPAYPGGYQTVINLCEFFDEQKMAYRLDKTVEYQTKNNECHKKCCSYLKCASVLHNENKRLVMEYTSFSKIELLANRIAKKEIKPLDKKYPIEHKRLMSAVTNQGVVAYKDTPSKLADKIYLIKDEYGVSSSLLLKILRDDALAKGYEIFTCYCPLDQKNTIEHLFIPALSLGFVTENKYHSFENIEPFSVISYTRFTALAGLRKKKQLLSFNKKAANEMIEEAVRILVYAKEIHDLLELQNTDAVNFEAVNNKTNEVINKINARGNIIF